MSVSICEQSSSQKGLLQSTKQLHMVDAKSLIFWGSSVMDDVHHVSPADTKLNRGHVRGSPGKGSGVLLLGVTAFFLAKDAFGHYDGNRAIVDCNFG